MQQSHHAALTLEHLGKRSIRMVDHDQPLGIGRVIAQALEKSQTPDPLQALINDDDVEEGIGRQCRVSLLCVGDRHEIKRSIETAMRQNLVAKLVSSTEYMRGWWSVVP